MRTSTESFNAKWEKWDDDQRAEYMTARAEAELAFDLAEQVYQARTGAGMTQAQLAQAMGVSQSHVSTLEGGGIVPTVKTLERIARATNRRLRVEFSQIEERELVPA
jgi:ribosome-binding protein aMBF1 (putative translation factor)